MKITLVGIICLICFSVQMNQTHPEEGYPFFEDYTQVLHFKYNITKEESHDFWSSKNQEDKGYPDCLFETLPDILDSKLAKKLFDSGFIRNEIRKKSFSKLTEIFQYRSTDLTRVAECLPTFRDILIFRKKKEVKGIVQICFTCSQYQIIGSEIDTRLFGQQSEFEHLKSLLYPD
ncbi:hypothetical protein [Crocinitomix catalasitica]|uniref:hypothetical protein n=1 Tax=Crocinitomix catalasitica TaxID=184607 RepID=UPI0012FCA905|nr:hypothetical protein [Crocinitomix catalasitica]